MKPADVPRDLAAALREAGLQGYFCDCTASHQREYLAWIAGAKKPVTRSLRIQKTVKGLAENRAKREGKPHR